MRRRARGLVWVALWATLLQAPLWAGAVGPSAPSDAVPAVVGRGTAGKAVCLACAMGIVAAGGLTWGGILVMSFFHVDTVVACGYICYDNFL